ncbi:MAG: flagellin, partial [Parahaliea sp.]
MAQIINTNIHSLTAQRNLNRSQNDLATSLQRLSSGLRINSAKDDAAGLAISERFTAQIRGLNQAARNANDGISLAQTAEGALGEVTNNLQRIRELAVQSANATNSSTDRAALDAEVQQLIAEIDRVANQTSFNGVKLLDGSFSEQMFQVGANVGDTIAIDKVVDSTALGLGLDTGQPAVASASISGFTEALTDGELTINGTSVGDVDAGVTALATAISAVSGVTATATSSTYTLDVSTSYSIEDGESMEFTVANANGDSDTITISNSTGSAMTVDAAALATAINSGNANSGVTAADSGSELTLTDEMGGAITVSAATVGATSTAGTALTGGTLAQGGIEIATDEDVDLVVAGTDPSKAGLSAGTTVATSNINLLDVDNANAAITAVDAALTNINSTRADLGAIQNRFESVVKSLQTSAENMDASRSRIRDADFAAETAALARAQILQ